MADQGFDSRPNGGVAINLGVGLSKSAIVPRVLRAMNRVFLVIEAKISQDLRFCRVGRMNFRAAVDYSVGLIEVHGARDVGRNHAIIRAEALHAVHLNGKENGNSAPVEFAGKLDHRRAAPAVAIQNNARLAPLVFRKQARAVRSQLCENHVQRLFTMPILESFNEYAAGVFGAKVMSQLYFAANGIIRLDHASYKSNDDYGRFCRNEGNRRDGRPVVALHDWGGAGRGAERQQQDRRGAKGRE